MQREKHWIVRAFSFNKIVQATLETSKLHASDILYAIFVAL